MILYPQSVFHIFILIILIEEGGLWWFTNLATPDPYYILPILAGATTLFMTELGADGMNANGQISTKYMMRGMSLFTVFIAAKMSSVSHGSFIDE